MKKRNFFFLAIIIVVFASCSQPCDSDQKNKPGTDSPTATRPPLQKSVLTAEEQRQLTPDMVIQSLKEGNRRFTTNDLTARDHSAMVRNAAAGQFPKAAIISCLDSRIPVEDVFDRGIGELFVGRVAGNL